MISLGLDISQKSTGWAVLDDAQLVDSGILDFSKDDRLSDNLVLLSRFISTITKTYPGIEIICIEDTFFGKNIKTLKLLTRFGAAAIIGARSSAPDATIILLAVQSIRSALFPGRKVDKQDVYSYICIKYGLSGIPDDITDAIAVGSVPFLKEDISQWVI